MILRLVMNQTWKLASRHGYTWNEEAQAWRDYAHPPRDDCDYYNVCGPNAYCIISDIPTCHCLTRFKPKSQKCWDMEDWTQGCSLTEQLSCTDKSKDGFLFFSGMKYPNTSHSRVNESMNLNQCRDKCLENCSCTAYANSNVGEGGRGCLMWFSDLKDVK